MTAALSPAQKAWATRKARLGLAPSAARSMVARSAPARSYEQVTRELAQARHAISLFERMPAGPERNRACRRADNLYEASARLQAELSTLSPASAIEPAPKAVTPAIFGRRLAAIELPAGATLCLDFKTRTTPLTEAEIAALELPAFLRRARA